MNEDLDTLLMDLNPESLQTDADLPDHISRLREGIFRNLMIAPRELRSRIPSSHGQIDFGPLSIAIAEVGDSISNPQTFTEWQSNLERIRTAVLSVRSELFKIDITNPNTTHVTASLTTTSPTPLQSVATHSLSFGEYIDKVNDDLDTFITELNPDSLGTDVPDHISNLRRSLGLLMVAPRELRNRIPPAQQGTIDLGPLGVALAEIGDNLANQQTLAEWQLTVPKIGASITLVRNELLRLGSV